MSIGASSAPVSASSPDAGSGFFSQVSAGLAGGVSRVASDLLPIWAAGQLGLQSQDQLRDQTFNTLSSAPAIDTLPPQQQTGLFGPDQQTQFFPISTGGALVLVAAILGVVFLARR